MFVVPTETQMWARQQFGLCELGDRRRTQRAVSLAASLASSVGDSIPRIFKHDSAGHEAAYRFARNNDIAYEELVRGGGRGTATRITSGVPLLALCDSSFLDFSHPSARDDMGDSGGSPKSKTRGVWSHNVLLVQRQGLVPLGILHQDFWLRDADARGQAAKRRSTPYEDKESYKWERAIEACHQHLTLEQRSQVVFVCDREADIFELMHNLRDSNTRFVIRASWDRALVDQEKEYLFEKAKTLPNVGTRQVQIAQRGGRPARQAQLTLSSGRVQVRPPKRLSAQYAPIELNVVLAVESAPPAGSEALQWLLLTSEAVDSEAGANEVVTMYAARWMVEDFHKAWKSGCKVEELRMQSKDGLLRMTVLLAQVAARLLRIRQLAAATQAEELASNVLEPVELKCLVLALSNTRDGVKDLARIAQRNTPMTASEAYRFIGNIGGWHDSKRTGRIGWEAFWRGWNKLAMLVQMAVAFEQSRCD